MLKSPACPEASLIDVLVIISILGCLLWSINAGEIAGLVHP